VAKIGSLAVYGNNFHYLLFTSIEALSFSAKPKLIFRENSRSSSKRGSTELRLSRAPVPADLKNNYVV